MVRQSNLCSLRNLMPSPQPPNWTPGLTAAVGATPRREPIIRKYIYIPLRYEHPSTTILRQFYSSAGPDTTENAIMLKPGFFMKSYRPLNDAGRTDPEFPQFESHINPNYVIRRAYFALRYHKLRGTLSDALEGLWEKVADIFCAWVPSERDYLHRGEVSYREFFDDAPRGGFPDDNSTDVEEDSDDGTV